MSRLWRSKKGASSVLVILMLVVLVVFGVAALTTALANVRLGQKAEQSSEKYYAAEALASERYAMIDAAVQQGQQGQSLSSFSPLPDEIGKYLGALDFDVITEETPNGIRCRYEAWEGDVGLRVVLEYDCATGELLPAQWQQVLKEADES